MSDKDRPKDTKEERPVPLSAGQLASLAQAVIAGSGSLVPTEHFKKRGRERNFSMQDALEVLRTGTVIPAPIWNEKTVSWNYDIGGRDLEGESLTVRVAPMAFHTGLVLVTAF
jgi:hypothetical protein